MNQQSIPSPFFRKFMIVLASIICVFYLAYRAIYTFNLSTSYAVFASVFLYVGEFFGIMNLLLFFVQVWEVSEPPMQAVLEGRTVDVLVPTYNEDPALLRATLEACIRMDYPHKTYVLDDGRRPEVEALSNELGVIYISRPDNRHAKAGNLNNALEQTNSEFVVVLDADHVPDPHFITRLIGYFRDEQLAFVQTPHAFYNFDSFQARLDHKNRRYWEEGDLFYRVIQPGRNKWNAPIFAGSAAMFRRQALKEIGYIATETITEDLHTGLRLHARGWKSIAISERLIAGQAPPDISTFHSQRLRWGEGNLSIMAYDNPLTRRGLTLPQRLCYFGSMIHWASGLFKLAIYLTPILMLFTGVPPVREFSWDLMVVILTYLFFSLYAMKVVSNGYGSIINSELFSMVNFWTQIKATFRALFRRKRQRFVVTSKRGPQSKSVWPYVRPQTYLILLSVLAIFWGWLRLSLDLNPVRAVARVLTRSGLDATISAGNWLTRQIDGTLLNHPLVVGFNISDDYFKPVVPTIWCLIFFWLAYKVTQRAFWPANRRFSTRHQVHLPIEYEVVTDAGTAIHYGVTVDLNDTGMAVVVYEAFPMGAVIRFTIRGAGEVVKCKGEIRSGASVAHGHEAEGHRYGVQFQNLTSPQVDAINRICLHYAVPRMFDEYELGNRDTFWNRFKLWQSRGMAQRRVARRNPFHLPIIINTGTTEETTAYSTTEDISRVAASAMFDADLQPGSDVGYLMPTPLGDVRGTARVLRSQPQQIAGRTYHRCVLEFGEFEGQGRTTIQSLVNPAENSPLTHALNPDRKTFLPNMKVPILVGLCLAAVLIVVQMGGVFPIVYQDDQFLRKMNNQVDSGQGISVDETKRYKRIVDEVMKDDYPMNDTLVLALELANKINEKDDVVRLTQVLAKRDPRNLKLAKSLIHAYTSSGKYAEADAEYRRLKDLVESGKITDPNMRREIQLAGARLSEKSGNHAEAARRFKEVYDKEPENAELRNEYAGVALTAGATALAVDILVAQDDKLDPKGRELLIAAYIQPPNTQFDRARAQAGKLKADPNNLLHANELEIKIEEAAKDYDRLLELLTKLADKQKDQPNYFELQVKIAHAHIGLAEAKNKQTQYAQYDQALKVLYPVLDRDREKGTIRHSAAVEFVAAASMVEGIEAGKDKYVEAKANTVRIYANLLYSNALDLTVPAPGDALYFAHLGWVLQRLGETEKSAQIVKRAAAASPNNDGIRRQLAGILLRAGNAEAAAQVLMQGGMHEAETRKLLIGIHIEKATQLEKKNDRIQASSEWTKAIDLARSIADQTKDWEDERQVADIYSWRGERTDLENAIKIYEKHLRDKPEDTDAEARVAEITLWAAKFSKEYYGDAVAKYQALLSRQDKFPIFADKYGDGFINAAYGAPPTSINPAQLQTARLLAAHKKDKVNPDPLILARLAWILMQGKDPETAQALLVKAYGIKLDDPKTEEDKKRVAKTKEELGRILAKAGMFKEAVTLQADPRTAEDHLALAGVLVGANNFDEAEKEVKVAIDAIPPLTPEKLKEARIMLADIYSYKGNTTGHTEALKMFAKLMADFPDDEILKIRHAEVLLWKKDYDKAIEEFQVLYDKNSRDERIWKGYMDTAAALGGFNKKQNEKNKANPRPIVPPGQVIPIRAIAERVDKSETKDPVLLARTALVLTYIDEKAKSTSLINRAIALKPTEPVVRREMADILGALGRFNDAVAMYTDLPLTKDDRIALIDYATAAEKLDLAVTEARKLLASDPKEPKYKRTLAKVLSWRGDFAESLSLYEQLIASTKGAPADLLEFQMQLADVILWSRQYPEALERFGLLINAKAEQDRVAFGFIDAASSAPSNVLTPTQEKQALQILERINKHEVLFEKPIDESEKLTRLAWVIARKTSQPEKADALLDKVLDLLAKQPVLDPTDKNRDVEARRELAGVLSYRDRILDAIRIFAAIEGSLDFADRVTYINLLVESRAEEHLALVDGQMQKLVFTKIQPTDFKARLVYAEMLLWAGKYDKRSLKRAAEQFELLAREYPRETIVQVRLAQAILWNKDYDEAFKRFAALFDNPQDSDAKMLRDIWMGTIDSMNGAVGNVTRKAANDNERVEKYVEAFFTPERRGLLTKAYQMIDKVKPVAPKTRIPSRFFEEERYFAESMARLGNCMAMIGQKDASKELFERAISIARDDKSIWLTYAEALKYQKEYQKALVILVPLEKGELPTELPR